MDRVNNWCLNNSGEPGFNFRAGDTFNNNYSSSDENIGSEVESGPIHDYDTALARHVGMYFAQLNAQKILGPPFEHVGPPPSSGSELYLKNLPRDLPSCIPELYDLFKQMGKIYTIRILVNFSGSPKGFGFVSYYSADDADRALLSLQGHYLRHDRPLHIQMSVDNHYLTISDLPADKTDEDILAEVTSVAGEGVREVKVARDHNKPKFSIMNTVTVSCTCTIGFSSHKSASNARRDFLTGKSRLWGDTFSAEWVPRDGEENLRGRQPQHHHQQQQPRRPKTSYRRKF